MTPRGEAGLFSFPAGLKPQSPAGFTCSEVPSQVVALPDLSSGAVVPSMTPVHSREKPHLLSDVSHGALRFKACTPSLPMCLLRSLCSPSPLLSCHGLAESMGFPRAFLSYF